MSEWISVDERLPELDRVVTRGPNNEVVSRISGSVLVALWNHDEGRYFVQQCYYDPANDGWQHKWERQFNDGTPWNEVTHWQPLPAPPEAPSEL